MGIGFRGCCDRTAGPVLERESMQIRRLGVLRRVGNPRRLIDDRLAIWAQLRLCIPLVPEQILDLHRPWLFYLGFFWGTFRGAFFGATCRLGNLPQDGSAARKKAARKKAHSKQDQHARTHAKVQ